jgi:hypothetical protein
MPTARTLLATGLTAVAVAAAGAALTPDRHSDRPESAATAATASAAATVDDPVLVGAGDITSSNDEDTATAALVAVIPGTVFTLGDNAYPRGRAADFRNFYQPTWGAFLARTRPAPGNHEYLTSGARAYFDYFGATAGPRGRGYYSYDLGAWHIVSLDSEISMRSGSTQERWLERNLDRSSRRCTLAYWHRPRFTSGARHGPATDTAPLVRDLYRHHAEVIVAGHNHQYERFGLMDPNGRRNSRGIRFFVVGTGGAEHYGFGKIQPHSGARNSTASGVIKFTLHTHSYDWEFVPVAGQTFTDHGSGTCS